MFNSLLRYLALFVATIVVCHNASANDAAKEPNQLFWSASKESKQLFIVGSIHVANQSFYPLDSIVYQRLKDSDALVVEVSDLESKETASYLNQIIQLPKGQKITDNLTQDDINRATQLGKNLGIPFTAFQFKKPWYYSMVMTSIQAIKMGYQPQEGIDIHFISQAQKQELTIIGLETSKQQLDMIDSIPFDHTQFAMVLDELESTEFMIKQLIDAWKKGDLESIDQIMKISFEASPEMEHILITQRNQSWATNLNNLLEKYDNLFIVVGAGHLPGDNGLLNLLKIQGFKLETPL